MWVKIEDTKVYEFNTFESPQVQPTSELCIESCKDIPKCTGVMYAKDGSQMCDLIFVTWNYIQNQKIDDLNFDLFFKHETNIRSALEAPDDCLSIDHPENWELVRSLPAGSPLWHKATDKLLGTDSYGTPNSNSEWTIKFETKVFD